MQFSLHREGFLSIHIMPNFDAIPLLYLHPTTKGTTIGYDGNYTLL